MAKTASDHLIEALTEWGVDTIFGLPGDGINGIMEALRTHKDRVRFIQVRHEEAAAFAACGYAKFTGRLGVCLATSGPGAIHLLNGLYDAKMDGVSVLAITGQQYSDLLGTSYQQEVDLLSLFKDVAAYNQQFQGPSDITNLVHAACRTALSKRTVAHLTFPIDYQVAEADEKFLLHYGGPAKTRGPMDLDFVPAFYTGNGHFPRQGRALDSDDLPKPSAASLQHAAEILNAGQKVAILVGHGALHARREVEQLAEVLGAPVSHALLGKTVLPDEHPCSIGGLGLLGSYTSDMVMESCDTLLMIGTNFPYAKYLPKPDQARAVQIDVDETHIGLRYPIEAGLVGDTKSTLQALLPLLQRQTDRSFLEKAQKNKEEWVQGLEAEGQRMDMPMKPQVVARVLSELAAEDAIIAGDHLDRAQLPRAGQPDVLLLGQPGHHGARPALCPGRAGGLPRPAGDRLRGRRRLHHAHGRDADGGQVPPADQGGGGPQRLPGPDQVGADRLLGQPGVRGGPAAGRLRGLGALRRR
jgi:thiamine pyrophosphate-dependent acetolactate synthase large subunit-like protein